MQKKFVEIRYIKNGINRVQKITLSAMLAALSLVFVLFMPTIDLGVWSFTPFSHLFLFLAIFISPFTGGMTYLTVFFGFVLKGANPLILLRAGSHAVFAAALIFIIFVRPVKSTKQFAIWAVVTALIHAAAEILAVLLGIAIGLNITNAVTAGVYIAGVVGGGTFVHSMIDIFAAYGMFIVLKRAFPWLNARASAPAILRETEENPPEENKENPSEENKNKDI